MCTQKLIKAQVTCPSKVAGMGAKIYFADARHIQAIPAAEDYEADPVANDPLTISGDITFDVTTYPGTGWMEWDVGRDTVNLTEELAGDPGQQYIDQQVPFKITGQDPLYDQALQWSIDLGLIALIPNKFGGYRLVGDKANPAYLNFRSDHGLVIGDFTGHECTLQRASNTKAYYYTGAITMAS